MSISTNISAFIYMGILLIGTITSTIYIAKSILEKQPLYKVGGVFTSAFLLYSTFEFLLLYFANNPDTVGLFRVCAAISDICYFFMVVSWMLLLGILSGNPFLVRKKHLFIITIIYAIIVEISVAIHWKLEGGYLTFGTEPFYIIKLIILLNLIYSIILAVGGLKYLIFAITRMHGEKSQKFVIAFSLVFIGYLIWIAYWDYSIASDDFDTPVNILKFDPILIVFFASCLISLGMFYKKEALRMGFYKEDVLNQGIEEDALWKTMADKYQLTLREIEIVQLVYQGQSNPDIGKELFIAENTVKRHLNHIYKKTETKNRYELLSTITKASK